MFTSKTAMIATALMMFTSPVWAQDKATPPPPQYVVDLSHALSEDFPWIEAPGTFPFSKEPIATIESAGVAANKWTIHEHLGTQIDAPAHFQKGGRTMDQMRPDELTAPIAVIDFKDEAAANVDAEITVGTIEEWEAEHGPVPQGAIVVMNSGWAAKVGDPKAFINLDETGTKRFPGFGVEAIVWLVENRDIWGVGVDTISFDVGRDNQYRAHKALEARDRWAIEAMNNLDRLPPVGATLYVGAANVKGATGGPVRPIAMWTDASLAGSTAPDIEGRWRSQNPEPLPDGEGGFRYLTRDFTFEDGRWSIDFTIHADEDRETLLFSGRNEGPYAVEDETMASGAFPAKFDFASRALTPAIPAIAEALTNAGCGSEPWKVGAAQDVLAEGCDAFRIFSKEKCAGEFDVVKVTGAKLFLGPRPADGFMCTADRRPDDAGDAPLVKVE